MPRATVSMAPVTYNLLTCPGGWVKLRRMSYGELLTSQDMAYQVSVKESKDGGDPDMGVNVTQAKILEYQFKTCILDHNLTNESDQKLRFDSAEAVHMLDSLIGQEINAQLEKMHRWDKTYPNSDGPSTSASSTNGATETAASAPTSPQVLETAMSPTS
jgi:hypothetical protein